MGNNPYLPVIYRNLPRLLALYQDDRSHPLYGCGDRRYWGWKLMDFPNATFQGAAFGLAHLYRSDMLPDFLPREACLERIIAMINVLPNLMDRRGGLAEALPNEGSFCVTGLVLGDVLGAIDLLREDLGEAQVQSLLDICAPMADFLKKQDEVHGMISNHLASCALGMVRWHQMTGDEAALSRAKIWIDRIKQHSNEEGWMSEYGTADPGYQSWCSTALTQIEAITDQFDLQPILQRSYKFLQSFALPDGSFANGCGGRMTRFLFAGGAEMRGEVLAQFAQTHIGDNSYVTLDSIDEPNMVPLFNDTVLAAVHFKQRKHSRKSDIQTMHYEDAGLLVHRGESHITTVNTRRGGWISRIPINKGQRSIECEPAGHDDKGRLLCAKNGEVVSFQDNKLEIRADFFPVQRMMPSPFKFIILRGLSMTVFHSLHGGNWIKRMLSALLLKSSGSPAGWVIRRIDLNTGEIDDEVHDTSFTPLKDATGFSPMHMASQGYWQVSDDTTS